MGERDQGRGRQAALSKARRTNRGEYAGVEQVPACCLLHRPARRTMLVRRPVVRLSRYSGLADGVPAMKPGAEAVRGRRDAAGAGNGGRRSWDAGQSARPASIWRHRLSPHDARRRHCRPAASERRHRLARFIGSLPALRAFGFDFLISERWNPVTENFGALAPIYGTLVTSFIAMLIAVPVGLLIAFFLTELCPQWLRRPIGIAIELLAGIPEHHLRHLGPVRFRAVPAGHAAAVPDRHVRRRPGHLRRFSPARPTASACSRPG